MTACVCVCEMLWERSEEAGVQAKAQTQQLYVKDMCPAPLLGTPLSNCGVYNRTLHQEELQHMPVTMHRLASSAFWIWQSCCLQCRNEPS